jgi:hypothetical protein
LQRKDKVISGSAEDRVSRCKDYVVFKAGSTKKFGSLSGKADRCGRSRSDRRCPRARWLEYWQDALAEIALSILKELDTDKRDLLAKVAQKMDSFGAIIKPWACRAAQRATSCCCRSVKPMIRHVVETLLPCGRSFKKIQVLADRIKVALAGLPIQLYAMQIMRRDSSFRCTA